MPRHAIPSPPEGELGDSITLSTPHAHFSLSLFDLEKNDIASTHFFV